MENCPSIPQKMHSPQYCSLTHNTSLALSSKAMLTMKVHKRTTQPLCTSCLARRHWTGTRRVPSCLNGTTSWALSKGRHHFNQTRASKVANAKESWRWMRLPQYILRHCYATCMANYCKSWTHRPLLATCDKAKHTVPTSWWMHTLPLPGAALRMSAVNKALRGKLEKQHK